MFMWTPLTTAGYGWGWYPTETEIKNQSERRKFENRVATERRVVEDLNIRDRKPTMFRRIHLTYLKYRGGRWLVLVPDGAAAAHWAGGRKHEGKPPSVELAGVERWRREGDGAAEDVRWGS